MLTLSDCEEISRVARNAEDGEAAAGVPLLQPLEAVVLRSETALGGDVHHEGRYAGPG
jgi:hypothetical protein